MNHLLPIYKPTGLSTYDLIRIFKNNNPEFKKTIKIGHAGTLDPFADGLVILLLGQATKKFSNFQSLKKTYIATSRLGYSSNTLDIEGELKKQSSFASPTLDTIKPLFQNFPQQYDQTIPAFSAAKHHGQPLYKLAKKDQYVHKTKSVTIHHLELISFKPPLVSFTTTVSSGTYIRQLSFDIFQKIGIKSFLSSLTRTQIGEFKFQNAAHLENIYNQTWNHFLISNE